MKYCTNTLYSQVWVQVPSEGTHILLSLPVGDVKLQYSCFALEQLAIQVCIPAHIHACIMKYIKHAHLHTTCILYMHNRRVVFRLLHSRKSEAPRDQAFFGARFWHMLSIFLFLDFGRDAHKSPETPGSPRRQRETDLKASGSERDGEREHEGERG